jgi:hypothetical protein
MDIRCFPHTLYIGEGSRFRPFLYVKHLNFFNLTLFSFDTSF